MRAVLSGLGVVSLLLVAAAFAPEPTCRVTLLLTDADSGRPVAGVIRFTHESDGQRVVLTPKGLDSRGWGLLQRLREMEEWFVLPQETAIELLAPASPRKLNSTPPSSGRRCSVCTINRSSCSPNDSVENRLGPP
ncbi:MAG: hypothetical protein ACKV2Q_07405 [Planctomycetaceae bacterium]